MVTNDDGIHSCGLQALVKALSALGSVIVVAPDRERSAVGHSLTLHSPLRADEISEGRFAVSGTPTDCVNLGIHGLLNAKPDLIVSGINKGGNLGDDLTYSGTVAAAMEATLMGVPSFAISLESKSFTMEDFLPGAQIAADIARIILANSLPEDTFLNVNIPAGVPVGVQLTRQGKRRYSSKVEKKYDPRGRAYYWIGGGELSFHDVAGTDFHAIQNRSVSITPLHLDLTNYRSFDSLSSWDFDSLC
jgi:5'-nucleotidase